MSGWVANSPKVMEMGEGNPFPAASLKPPKSLTLTLKEYAFIKFYNGRLDSPLFIQDASVNGSLH